MIIPGMLFLLGLLGFMRIFRLKYKDFSDMEENVFYRARKRYLLAYVSLILGGAIPLGITFYIQYFYLPTLKQEEILNMLGYFRQIDYGFYIFYCISLLVTIFFHKLATSIDKDKKLYYEGIFGKKVSKE